MPQDTCPHALSSLSLVLCKTCTHHLLFYPILHTLKIFQDMTIQFCGLQFFLLQCLTNLQLQFGLHQALQQNHHHIQAKLCCKILHHDFHFAQTRPRKFFACSCQFCCILTLGHPCLPVLGW